MDDLISKLRSTQRQTQEKLQEKATDTLRSLEKSREPSYKDNMGDIFKGNTQLVEEATLRDEGRSTFRETFPCGDIREGDESDCSIFEITTSQSDALASSRFKLDFELLFKYRKGDFITADEINKSADIRIIQPFYAIIKSIETYSNDVHRLELCDDTGIICGSSNISGTTIKVGNLVCLKGCSLWKVDGNHLNIVESNVISIHKC